MGSASTLHIPLSGWGRFPTITARVARPDYPDQIIDLLKNADPGHPILARGLGRSYGDAALNARGITLDLTRMNRMLSFDDRRGILTCEAGTSYEEILRTFVPRGWFPAVTPGTRFVTVGGAVAHDVHGKNHHQDGAFSRFVESFRLLTGKGEIVECSRDQNVDLFKATLGGLGLTGIILDVSFRLKRIETAFLKQKTVRTKDLFHTLALFDQLDADFPYSVAWIDCLARGSSRGRGVAFFGKHSGKDELRDPSGAYSLTLHRGSRLTYPFTTPSWLLNRFTVGGFNRVFRWKHPREKSDESVHYGPFFYPLDFIHNWNRAYGKRGFTQFQCVLPEETGRKALDTILTATGRHGQASFLSVLKKMGPADEGFLSFPLRGFTLSMDFPIKAGIAKFLLELTKVVLDHGGRMYLAKDATLDPESFRKMYPLYDNWRSVVATVNPDGLIRSEMAERLQLLR